MHKSLPRRSKAGYTLVELIVVIVIVAVLAAIAAPGWLAFMNSRRANAARDQIFQALRQAQAQAIRGKESQPVTFDTAAALPTIKSLEVIQSVGDGQLEAGDVALRVRNGTAALRDDKVEFDANGNLKIADLLSEQGIKITVTVPPNTGSKRCVIVQTLLGSMRAGSDDECD
ncbi:MAG: prepilin-type N-terminal cleavage/methylation domain-containing protein [Leptolyngbyaceae cyanobacterium CRU_2_3]|nr:prepilin-type N-terminal cleavage/methylation domain-containing protein [Leptolyngbyaceae cyanobacterium CRU_2_3]